MNKKVIVGAVVGAGIVAAISAARSKPGQGAANESDLIRTS